jgi:hypothetical protein
MASLGSTPAARNAKSSAAPVTPQKSSYSPIKLRSQVYSNCFNRQIWVITSPFPGQKASAFGSTG